MSLAGAFTPAVPLVLVGAGKMGGALLAGWLDRGLDPAAVVVIDPAPPADIADLLSRAGIASLPAAPTGMHARVLVLAVKPQIIADVLPRLRPLVGPDTVALSIAAGTTLAGLEVGLGPAAIVRAMPNTPAQVGRGIAAAVVNPRVDAAGRVLVTTLLEAVGAVAWVDEEEQIDAVTAISGSGPAYVFHFVEALAAAAVGLGLPVDLARKLARATVEGAGELLYRSDLPPEQLRKNVTSPGGTTAAALEILMADEHGLTPLLKKAAIAARRRARELSG